MKRRCLLASLIGLSFISAMNASASPLPVPERGFVSLRPAENWEEGLITGNGTIGINALSRPLDERIIFSHERLFMPMGPPTVPPDQSARLPEIRKLIAEGKYKDACNLQFKLSGQKSFMYPDFFVPAFDLTIKTGAKGKPRDYARSVDFQTGEAVVHWADERGAFERRMFVSRKHGVAVIQLTAPAAGALDCQLKLEPREPSDEFNKDSDIRKRSDEMFKEHFGDIKSGATKSSLSFKSRFLKAYPDSIQHLEGYARVVAVNGTATPDPDGSLDIKDADRVMIFVDIRLPKDASATGMPEMETALGSLGKDYASLLDAHAKLHGELFKRMRLDIGGGDDHKKSSEELLELSTYDSPNAALIEKEFDAGRYNIICSTGDLPPTLQGVWGGTYVPGWASDFTHNGNVPSAIAANLQGNMPELNLAYTSYIESLIPDLELNAKHLFGARGIVLPSRSTTHGYNNALAPNFAGGMWAAGAGWAARSFHDYYLYTGDREFLEKHALPFMEKATLFFEDYCKEGADGKYILSPATSPENTPGNTDSQATFNATMDVAVAKELLRNVISASRELDRNADKIPVWEKMLTGLPDYQINKDGIIKEWLTPKLANNDNHRHSSQLYPLYYGLPEEVAASPELQAAFRSSLEYKLARHWKKDDRGFMSFGIVQLGQVAASLGEGEIVFHCLRHLVDRFWLSNLASMHNHGTLFNMDISGGMPAVIIQALVGSEAGTIQLLPALPKAWPKGSIEGVLCRGAIEIKQLQWDGKTVQATLVSKSAQSVTLELPAPIAELKVTAGKAKAAQGEGAQQRQLELPAGTPVTIQILLK